MAAILSWPWRSFCVNPIVLSQQLKVPAGWNLISFEKKTMASFMIFIISTETVDGLAPSGHLLAQ